MTVENYGSVWQIDDCLPTASFNLLDENDMKKCFNWTKLRPMFCTENNSKKAKLDPNLYILQEIEAKFLIKLNERYLVKSFIDEIYGTPPRKIIQLRKKIYNHIDEIWSIDLALFQIIILQITKDSDISLL